MNVADRKASETCEDHLKRLKHKKMLVAISTKSIARYNGSEATNTTTIPPIEQQTEEDIENKITGCYTFQCTECAFNEIIWGHMNEKNTEALYAFDAHRKRFKHKVMILTTTSLWIARYDEAKDDVTSEPAPKNEFFNY